MTIVTINRAPSWGDLAVGAIVNLPPALADPLIAAGEAVPTPGATPTVDTPFGGGGGAQVGSEAEMVVLAATVGTRCIRTDIGSAPGTMYECIALPASDAGNWVQVSTAKEVWLPSGTWDSRPVDPLLFESGVVYWMRMTDVGQSPLGTPCVWVPSLSRWWLAQSVTLVLAYDSATATPAAATSIYFPTTPTAGYRIPAGILRSCAWWRVSHAGQMAAAGVATDTVTQCQPVLARNNSGAYADITALKGFGTGATAMAANTAGATRGIDHDYMAGATATDIVHLGATPNAGSWTGATDNAVHTNVTPAGSLDLDDELYLALAMAKGVVTNNVAISLRTLRLTLHP